MIKYKKYNALIKACDEAYNHFYAQTIGYPFEEEKQNVIYNSDIYERFEADFQKNITNATEPIVLQKYFNTIYYNGIARLYISFNDLAQSYEKSRENRDEVVPGADRLFTRIYNGYCYSFCLLASKIRAKGLELGIVELKPVSEISQEDYNISGGYTKHLQKEETKTGKLTADLEEYGFFELENVKSMQPENQRRLIESLITKGLPYQIAMLDYLGFLKFLQNERCTPPTKYALFKKLSKILDSPERTIKGNINVLGEKTEENKRRYTAHLHKESVKKDFQMLK